MTRRFRKGQRVFIHDDASKMAGEHGRVVGQHSRGDQIIVELDNGKIWDTWASSLSLEPAAKRGRKPGVKTGPRRPYPLWLAHAAPGDTFVHIAPGPTDSEAISIAFRSGKRVTTERVVVLRGSMATPTATPAVIVTMVGDKQ